MCTDSLLTETVACKNLPGVQKKTPLYFLSLPPFVDYFALARPVCLVAPPLLNICSRKSISLADSR